MADGQLAPWMTITAAISVAIAGLGSTAGLLASIMQTRRDRLLAGAVIAVLAIVLWQLFAGLSIVHGWVPSPDELCPVEDFALRDIDGREVKLSDYRGRVVLIEVWRTWCGPCIAELPTLEYTHRLLEDEGLAVLLLSDEDPELQRPIRDEYGLTFPLLVQDSGLPRAVAGVQSFPTTFLVDRHGCLKQVSVRGNEGFRRLTRELRGEASDLPLPEPQRENGS